MTQPLSSAAQRIFAAADLAHEDVVVPEWDLNIRVRQLDAGQTAAFTRAMHVLDKNDGIYCIVIFTCYDAGTDERIFNYDTPDELMALIDQLRKKSWDVLKRLQEIAMRLNKMGAPAKEALKKD